MNLKGVFRKNKNIVIGAIHLPPLLGYKDFPGFNVAIKNALADLKTLEKGGVDAVIFENNYDIPHKIFVGPETVASMAIAGKAIKEATKLPVGISVLWNDYRAALSIAKALDLQFIRVPVFVDKVKTNYGIVNGNPKEVIEFRKSIGADNVAVFTDIHVKHAKLLSKYSLTQSAKMAIKNKSDALIITGKWTGDAPNTDELKMLRKSVSSFPILIGSGLDKNNAKQLFKYANGAIVSTSLKKGGEKRGEINVKPYKRRIDLSKVGELVRAINK